MSRLALVIAAAAAAAILLGLLLDAAAFLNAWLFAFVLWTGIALGCLGLLLIGHLLGDPWLHPIRAELEAGARTFPLLAAAAVPIALGLGHVYPWAALAPAEMDPLLADRLSYLNPGFFIARLVVYFLVWSVLGHLVARPGKHPRLAAAGLILLFPTASFASVDWIMSLDPNWLSSLYGLIFVSAQLLAALAGAMLIARWRGGSAAASRLAGLAMGLLALALLSVYLRLSQFLIVWAANLPHEVVWYLARGGIWAWIEVGVVVPMTAIAILLLLARRRGNMSQVIAAAALLLAQHPIQLLWQVRPAALMPHLLVFDLIAVGALGAAWLLLFRFGLREPEPVIVRP